MPSFRTLAVLVLLPLPAVQASAAQVVAPGLEVRQVASDTLHDVALMRIESGQPVIYFNPRLLQRLGPELTRFFLTHEHGHAAIGHTGGSALAGPMLTGTSLRLRQELEADCWATEQLARAGDQGAIDGAVEFFLQLGKRRHDLLHPTGSQRAAKIMACIPDAVVTSSAAQRLDDASPPR